MAVKSCEKPPRQLPNDEAGRTVQRVVDESGSVVERTLNESGEVLDEAVVDDASESGSQG